MKPLATSATRAPARNSAVCPAFHSRITRARSGPKSVAATPYGDANSGGRVESARRREVQSAEWHHAIGGNDAYRARDDGDKCEEQRCNSEQRGISRVLLTGRQTLSLARSGAAGQTDRLPVRGCRRRPCRATLNARAVAISGINVSIRGCRPSPHGLSFCGHRWLRVISSVPRKVPPRDNGHPKPRNV